MSGKRNPSLEEQIFDEVAALAAQYHEIPDGAKTFDELVVQFPSIPKSRLNKWLAQKLRSGIETRDVEVVICVSEAGVVQEIRADTGEMLITRAALDSERQMLLELHPPADGEPGRTDEDAAAATAATEAP